jgi:17beta-estradiol 17-dehydrogenase / very-long-chain 3-oxoacyl-CoA reductase
LVKIAFSDNIMAQPVVEYVGYLAILALTAKIGLTMTSWIYRRFLASSLNVTKCGGNWALVTGSTDGIGKAYAFALAKKKLNIVLVSRTPFKLQYVAADIKAKYPGVKTK